MAAFATGRISFLPSTACSCACSLPSLVPSCALPCYTTTFSSSLLPWTAHMTKAGGVRGLLRCAGALRARTFCCTAPVLWLFRLKLVSLSLDGGAGADRGTSFCWRGRFIFTRAHAFYLRGRFSFARRFVTWTVLACRRRRRDAAAVYYRCCLLPPLAAGSCAKHTSSVAHTSSWSAARGRAWRSRLDAPCTRAGARAFIRKHVRRWRRGVRCLAWA